MREHDAPLWKQAVSYGAIGASKAVDLLTFPPRGYRPFEARARIGHGDARWEHAWQSLMGWGAHRGSGFEVELAEAPDAVGEGTYQPVTFDTGGVPVRAATRSDSGELLFGPDGNRFIAPGDSATLTLRLGPLRVKAPVRVVYVVDERDRRGFAYGTLPGHPERGESSFVVERTSDGSVWLEVRGFSRPAHGGVWALYPALRLAQSIVMRRYLRALAGTIASTSE